MLTRDKIISIFCLIDVYLLELNTKKIVEEKYVIVK